MRRRRRNFRTRSRKARTFWVDTFQDAVPHTIDVFPGYDSDPSHNKVLVVPIIRQRVPQVVEDISSVLEGKDEGFRLRRIVGNLLFGSGQMYIDNTERRALIQRVDFMIRWGIMVHPIDAQRNFANLQPAGTYLFSPTESVSMSDPWLILRSEHLTYFGPFDRPTATLSEDNGLREYNDLKVPFGSFVDVTVNRRVKVEEDVSLFVSWNSTLSPITNDVQSEPVMQSNLRMLISR